jgi:hypothetical protein
MVSIQQKNPTTVCTSLTINTLIEIKTLDGVFLLSLPCCLAGVSWADENSFEISL